MDRDCGINRLHKLQPPGVEDHEQAERKVNNPSTMPNHRSIKSLPISNGRFPNADKDIARTTSERVHELSGAPGCNSNLSTDFTTPEIEQAIQRPEDR